MGLLDQFSGDGLMGGAGAFLQNPSFTPQSTSGNFGRGLLGYQEAKKEAELLKLKALLGASTMQHQSAMNEHMGIQNNVAQQGLMDKQLLGQAYQQLQGMGLDYSNPDHLNQAAGFLATKGLHQPANELRKQANDVRKDGVQKRRDDAASRLSGLLNPADGSRVYTNEKEADDAAKEYMRSGNTEPYNATFVPPNVISSLAVEADPHAALPALLRSVRPASGSMEASAKPVAGGYITKKADGTWDFNATKGAKNDAFAAGTVPAPAAPDQNGGRTEDTLRNDAMYQILNGKARPGSVPVGRDEGNPYRAAVGNMISKIAKELGLSEASLATLGPENKARFVALTNLQKDYSAIKPYEEMLNTNAKIAIDLAQKISRTNSPLINKPLNWLQNNAVQDPDVAEYLFQIQTVKTEGARILNNPRLVGQLTDTARKEMEGVINGNMSLGATERVIGRMVSDGKNRVNSILHGINSTRDEIRGTGKSTPVPTAAVTAPAPTDNVERGTSKSGKPMHKENGQWVYD